MYKFRDKLQAAFDQMAWSVQHLLPMCLIPALLHAQGIIPEIIALIMQLWVIIGVVKVGIYFRRMLGYDYPMVRAYTFKPNPITRYFVTSWSIITWPFFGDIAFNGEIETEIEKQERESGRNRFKF